MTSICKCMEERRKKTEKYYYFNDDQSQKLNAYHLLPLVGLIPIGSF